MIELDQELLIVPALGDPGRAHQFGVAAQQIDQNRQQAQALTIDDDAQFQVEPVALWLLIDDRVPVVYRRDVKREIFRDVDLPALLTQRWQVVGHEVQPGLVARQFEHVPGAVGQGLALPGRQPETEVLDDLSPVLFCLRIAAYAHGFSVEVFQDVGGFAPCRVMLAVAKRQRGAMLDMTLHTAIAWFVSAELEAGKNQPRHRLDVDQAFRQCGLGLGSCWSRRTVWRTQRGEDRGLVFRVLQKEKSGGAMFAIVAHGAGAFTHHELLMLGRVLESEGLRVDFQTRASAHRPDQLGTQVLQLDALLLGIVAPSLKALSFEDLCPRRG